MKVGAPKEFVNAFDKIRRHDKRVVDAALGDGVLTIKVPEARAAI
ncbi:hypothetical protein [Streptomyces acidicola]|nr:hypothetical protein [Streptomyces acidicola]